MDLLWQFVVTSLASVYITWVLIAGDSPLRLLSALRVKLGVAIPVYNADGFIDEFIRIEPAYSHTLKGTLAYLLYCPFCLMVWVQGALWLAHFGLNLDALLDWITYTMAGSTVSMFLFMLFSNWVYGNVELD